jgi:hypothetical protein
MEFRVLPVPFVLEPLTQKSLAEYVVAESPAPEVWTGEEADAIRMIANEAIEGDVLHRVGELYATIAALLEDPDAVRDADFRQSTYPFQSTWDEWGRGYKRGARGTTSGGAMPETPDVLVLAVTARTDTLAALEAVATQGEAVDSVTKPNSHICAVPAHLSATHVAHICGRPAIS